ncbi:MAG: hypothetical protein HN478_15185 [Rhodospirillaceae bacterium]|nr:hypothetical protein [Rhodospirillaceae bacterium]
MSVDYQDDIAEDWGMAGAMAETMAETMLEEVHAEPEAKFSNLNEALSEAGSVLGDLRDTLPISFRFTWHDMAIFCQIIDRDGEVALVLETDLGPVPYSVENKERRAYLRLLNDKNLELPIGEFTITARRRFRHRVEQALATPITGSSVVTSVVQLLLTTRPYHELAKAG